MRALRIGVLFSIIFTLLTPYFADGQVMRRRPPSSRPPPSRPPPSRSWKPKFEARVSLLPSYFFEDVGQGTSQFTTPIRAESAFSFTPLRDLKFRVAPWVYSDPSAKSTGEVFMADANEANADYQRQDWNIKAGINSIAWGVTDVYNPLDVVSARRYMDPLNSDKRGVPSVDVSWDNGTYRAEGIYVPVQFESVLPGENSRWLPRDVSFDRSTAFGKAVIAPQFKYLYWDREVVDNALNNGFGFRFERRGSGLDLTAIFFQGSPTAPAMFTPVITGRYDFSTFYASEITLQPIYYVRRTVGAGAVWTLDTAIVRFAAAHSERVSKRPTLPGWSQSMVLGIEKNFPIYSSTLTSLLQVTYAQNEEQADNTITSLDRIFDRSALLGLRLVTSNDWTWNVAALYDAAYRGWFGQLKVERKITDGATGSIQGDWLDGDPGTPLGTYRRNRRITLGLAIFY